MLTKELLRFSRRGGDIVPRTVDGENRLLLALVEALLDIYAEGEGQSLEELAELTQPLLNAYRSPLIAKGLNKLLLDRCTFQEADPGLPEWRLEVFGVAAALLRGEGMGDLTRYREAVARRMGQDPERLSASLYADLPVRQPLVRFQPIPPAGLIHRYNLAQAQGLLLWSDGLNLDVWEDNVPRLRAFLRYLRFFQLLARVERLPDGGVRMRVDGPLSLFEGTLKYGTRLANLLAVVVGLTRWRLVARVRLRGQRPATLTLDQESGLVSHFTRLGGYRPEEFALFAEQFRELGSGWQLEEEPPLLDLGGQEITVPDFSFRQGRRVVHLELFHRWHRGALERRLDHLERGRSKPPLAIGVDRALGKDDALAQRLADSPWFQEHGFLFNGFPPVKRVIKCLAGFLPPTGGTAKGSGTGKGGAKGAKRQRGAPKEDAVSPRA